MITTFAFECFADQDVFAFLKHEIGLPLDPLHSYNQGDVINDVLVHKKALVGLVDEDPHSTHHKLRDQMKVEKPSSDVELRVLGGRYIILLKPDLEHCFFRGLERTKIETKIAEGPRELHQMLGRPHRKKHEDFRSELKRLYDESKKRGVSSFPTELEEILRRIAG